jgi:imidazolonepropionase-like amidohydrolase
MSTVIRCGTLIDGRGEDPVSNVSILIEGDSIVAVGRDINPLSDAVQIDASQLTVMPGMIDCHVHLAVTPRGIADQLMVPFSFTIAEALQNARTTLEAGFTTVRDASLTPRGVKMAIDQGLFPGPRLRIAVSGIGQTGGHGDSMMPSGVEARPAHPEVPSGLVDGADAARRTARLVLRSGADQIKIITSGGVMSPSDEPESTGLTPDEIGAIVYEAHAAGKRVMSHAQATQGIKNAVNAGVESIEHGFYLDDEVIDSMVERGTYLVPTLIAPIWLLRRAESTPGSLPQYAQRKARQVIAASQASFRRAVERGVKIAMGTDMGCGPHGSNAEELSLMVQNGMRPMQAIVATTSAAADCVGIAQMTGTIEPGKRADLIVVKSDPLIDIASLCRSDEILLVMKDGQIHKNELLD